MDNAPLKPVVYGNFNNMTDEQLHDWPLSFLSEAQRENYVNQNLEIVRHYRTVALSRAPVFDIAIDAAIACHGLYRPHEATGNNNNNNTSTSTSTTAAIAEQTQQEERPPPVRRQRLQQQPEPNGGNETNVGNGHYVALAHIFSEAYAIRVDANSNTAINNNNNNNNINNNNININNNNEQNSDLNEAVMKQTIDNLGLRRT